MDLVACPNFRHEAASKAAHYSEEYGGVGTMDVDYESGGRRIRKYSGHVSRPFHCEYGEIRSRLI